MEISDIEILGDAINGFGSMGDSVVVGDDASLLLESLQGGEDSPAQLAARMALARRIDPRAVAMRAQRYDGAVYGPAGIPATLFTAGTATQVIALSVTRPFKPYEILIASTLAPFFRINSFSINGTDQFSGGVHAAEVFSTASFRSKLRFQTINPSAAALVNVTMTDVTQNRTFTLSCMGAAALK